MKRLLSLISIIPVVIIQTSFATHFSMAGYVPQLLLAIVLCWCLLKDYREALLWALIGGLLLDVFSTASFGTSALALVGVVVVIYLILQNVANTDKLYSRVWLGVVSALIYYLVILLLSFLLNSVRLATAPIEISTTFFLTVFLGVVFNVLFTAMIYPLLTAGYQLVMRFEHNREQKI